MDETQSLGSILDPSIANSRLGFKMTREKRSTSDSGGESLELTPKRVKMRDLESVFRSKGMEIHSSEPLGCQPVKNQLHFGKNEDTVEITKDCETMISDVLQTETSGQNTLSHPPNTYCLSSHRIDCSPNPRDLHSKSHILGNLDDMCQTSMHKDKDHETKSVPIIGIGLDLNAEGTSSSAIQNPFYPYKLSTHVKSIEASECGSSTGPLEENDSYRRWKEMKRNGFLSSAHGGIPIPEQMQRWKKKKYDPSKKKKTDSLKKKMELAKREQVHRFTKIAAPSGLLNGLNPGIINHVRNSKQVHSIIEALVRSERLENNIQNRSAGNLKGEVDTNEKGKNPENIHDSGASQSGAYVKAEHTNTSSGNMQTKDYPVPSSVLNMSLISEHKGGYGKPEITERHFYDETSSILHVTSDCEDEMLTLKLSSSLTTASENFSGSNDESANRSSVSSLSEKAATVASQWLELLYQDIRGRLAALRRSKKRVQSVIQTELPFLMMKEFSSTKENDPYSRQSSSSRCPRSTVSDMHRARWTALFDQMEKALTEEGKYLENWLNQVKEMQLQCERGLQHGSLNSLQSLGSGPRSKTETTERELAVRAAAASIYSTCNFVKATEDVSCF